MSKADHLKAAHRCRRAQCAAHGHEAIHTDFGQRAEAISKGLGQLKQGEREQIGLLAKAALARERRLCTARSPRYDLNRHLALYLTVRAIDRHEKAPGA